MGDTTSQSATGALGVPQRDGRSAPHERPAGVPRILIAAAEPEVGVLKALLAGLGHTVGAAARSGTEAIAMMETITDGEEPRPELALIDPALTGEVSGVAAARLLRRRFDISVIYVCDGDLPARVARAARATEPAGYVPKPFAPWHLRATIDAALAQQRRETKLAERARRLARERDALKRRVAALQDRGRKTETELRARLEAFKTQSVLLRTVVDSMGDGLIVADLEGRYLLSNPAMERLVGIYRPDSELSQRSQVYGLYYPDRQTLIPSDRLPLSRAVREAESTDEFDIFIRNAGHPEGILVSITGRPLYDAAGAHCGGLIVFRDVTRIRNAEQELKRSVSRFSEHSRTMKTVIDSISDGVVAADAAGNLTLFNPSAERTLGLGKTDMPPERRVERYGIYYPDQATPVPVENLPLSRARRGESSDDEEFFVRNPHVPHGVVVSVSGRPLRADDGTLVGGVIVLRDVTERVREHQTMLRAFAQGRLEMVDTVAHNIGNAINSVAIGVGTIQQEVERGREVRRFRALAHTLEQHRGDWIAYLQTDPQGRRVLPFIVALAADFEAWNRRLTATVGRVSARVAHIVDLIRTQKSFDGSSMVRKLVNLRQSIVDATKVLTESWGSRGITIDIDCRCAPRQIWIQESRFHQMLVNLMKNAIEAIDALAATGASFAPRIRIACAVQDEFLVLDVIDNGIGIGEQRHRLIFTAGYTTKKGGSGLGLHSAANFVISSGGRIEALSDGHGAGTTIRVMLRRSVLEDQAIRAKRPADEGH
jgi:PAS domain S-box-containing protein